MSARKQKLLIYVLFLLALIYNAGFSLHARDFRASWINVPPAPTEKGITALFLGDRQFAYRAAGLTLQNLGDTGGRVTRLEDYDYERLGRWFFLADSLDPVSNYIPLLAAFYFGAVKNADDLRPVIDYLAAIGQRPEGQKWRWLGQAVYLARFQAGDLNRALELATILAGLWREGRPAWMKQMPAFVMNAQGDKAASYDFMMGVLREEADRMHPNEVNFMVSYICERLLDEGQAAANPLCADYK